MGGEDFFSRMTNQFELIVIAGARFRPLLVICIYTHTHTHRPEVIIVRSAWRAFREIRSVVGWDCGFFFFNSSFFSFFSRMLDTWKVARRDATVLDIDLHWYHVLFSCTEIFRFN